MKFSVIVPVRNEEALLRRALGSLTTDLGGLGSHGEVIVVANACTDNTVATAITWLAEHQQSAEHPLGGQVIETEAPGKKQALNLGIDASRGEIIICADGDVLHDARSITWTVEHMACHPQTQLMGSVAVDNTAPGFLPADPVLAQLTVLVRERWLSLPTPQRVAGTYFAFRSNAGIRFPDGIAGDDLWVSAHIVDRFGLEALHVDPEYQTLMIAPQTWDDCVRLNTRFAIAHELLAEAHPDLADAIAIITRHIPSVAEDETNVDDWRRRCVDQGVDFADVLHVYKMVRSEARRQAPQVKAARIAAGGRWERTPSTKSPPMNHVVRRGRRGP